MGEEGRRELKTQKFRDDENWILIFPPGALEIKSRCFIVYSHAKTLWEDECERKDDEMRQKQKRKREKERERGEM